MSKLIDWLRTFFDWCDHDMNIVDCDSGGYVERCTKCDKIYIYSPRSWR